MEAVLVGIGEDDDLVIIELIEIKVVPTPAPSAEMIVRISSLANTWSRRFFSTLSGFPRRGRMD